MKIKISNGKNEVKYAIETIEEIVHGKYKDFYNKADIDRNNVKPNDSVIILKFKDGTTSSFSSNYKIEFYNDDVMSELDFMQIFSVTEEVMEIVNNGIIRCYYSGYYDFACNRMLESYLAAKNLCLNENMIKSKVIIDYVVLRRKSDKSYTISKWLKDTRKNYPEYFIYLAERS